MDEFGVLTERFGLKPQGKGAPMAASKRTSVNNNNAQTWNFGVESNTNPKSSSFVDDHSKAYNGGVSDDYDDIFGGGSLNSTKQSGAFGGGTAAGSSFDYDSLFSASNSNSNSNPTGKSSLFNAYDNDDIFGGMPGVSSSSFASKDAKNDDIFGSFAPATKQSAPIDDFLGGFVGAESKPKSSTSKMSSGFDDLIPGFGASSPPNNGRNVNKHRTTTQSTKPTFTSPEDPFIVLESTSASNSTSTSNDAYASSDLLSDPLERVSKINNSGDAKPPRLKSPPRATQISKEYNGAAKSSGVSSIDELEDFAMGRVQNSVNGRSKSSSSGERQGSSINRASSHSENDLESFFSMGARSNSAPRSRATTSDSLFDAPKPNNNRGGTRGPQPQPQPQVPPKMSSGTSPSIKKSSSASGIFDDLSSMFDGAQISGEFQEVEGESEERRNARFGRLQRTNERMAKAVADMNQRDFQSQQEQEERRRIAEAMDADIKRWAAGKEGNMRALLSSLQHVLWPECGWEPVSLTDIITSTSVKKVYWKATLCIHPDKVQQKGASLQQKYTAEKVFDILKEAWNKFKKEELS